jgi:hypothetical protein
VSNAVWSIVTAAVSVAGVWLAGHNPRWGWQWGLGAQVVWLVAGLATGRPGDVILSVVFTVIYLRNLRRWRGTRFQPAATASAAAGEPVLCPTGGAR